jgi:acetoin utilization protein AcuC
MKELDVVFHPKYLNYRLGPEHPFWPERAAIFLDLLGEKKVAHRVLEPEQARQEDLLLVNTPQYLARAKALSKERGLLSPDTPVNEEALEAAYYSVGGTYLACQSALKNRRVVNLLGGMHHASSSKGGGFCIFNDHAVAIKKLQREKKVKKIIVYDLDAHAGDGTQEIFYSDPDVFTVSLHQDPRTLFPGTGFSQEIGEGLGKGFNLNLSLAPGTGEKEYLSRLDEVLEMTKNYHHDLLVLILGVDTFEGDPLTQIALKEKSYRKIGKRFRDFPKVAVLFAGGYSERVPWLWLSFVEGFLAS